MKLAILTAYDKGYRVTDNGVLVGLQGRPLSIAKRGKQKYPTFSVAGVPNINNKYGVFGIPIHKFAAYCFYGESMFDSECVRHKNGNVLDISKENIALGTHSENQLDKSPEIRRSAASKARKSQGYRPLNAKLSDSEAEEVKTSKEKSSVLASKYKVSRQTIWNIRTGKKYGNQ